MFLILKIISAILTKLNDNNKFKEFSKFINDFKKWDRYIAVHS